MDKIFESYTDFADNARNIRGYGNWHSTSKKALKDLNEWLAVDELGPVTKEEMKDLEERYLDKKNKAWQRYWNALMGQCYAEQASQEELASMLTKKDHI